MRSANKSSTSLASANSGRFQFGPPRDSERMVHLFSVLLQTADEQIRAGKHFEVPFALLLRFARCKPSREDLRRYHDERETRNDWPQLLQTIAGASRNGQPHGMFLNLLATGLDWSSRFDVDGQELCRVLAAVGQTLGARNAEYRNANRMLEGRYRVSLTPPPAGTSDTGNTPAEAPIDVDPPAEFEFRGDSEQGGSVLLNTLALWHASHIGPAAGRKSENQDATYAVQAPGDPARPCIVFALADGVTTSMGARIAANSIVRRFCESLMRRIKPRELVSADDLLEAAREAQRSLDSLADALLHRRNSYVFDIVRGDSIQEMAAERILQNTLDRRNTRIPAALSSTLIGGVTQDAGAGDFRIGILRIGDGVVEQIHASGEISSIAATDSAVSKIAESVSPGPEGREVVENPEARIGMYSLTLRSGDSLIVSSDGLTRGHKELVSRKVSDLVGGPFWKASKSEPDAALKVLRTVCRRADATSLDNADGALFPDNVSLIVIGCGG